MKITPHVLKQLDFERVNDNHFKKVISVAGDRKEIMCRHVKNLLWMIETPRYPAGYQVFSVEDMIAVLCTDSYVVGREKVKSIINDALKPYP